jgi:hypothetical protein
MLQCNCHFPGCQQELRKMSVNSACKYLFRIVGIFNMLYNPTMAECFTFPLKEAMLWIFIITLKKQFALVAMIVPVNLGSNGKHENHLTTEGNGLG